MGCIHRENHYSERHRDPSVHCSTIYNGQDKETNQVSITRRRDKEDVKHTYSEIVLSHRKEWHWVIRRDVDAPRDCHREWSKSVGEKQIWCINAYTWSLEKWYKWSSVQSRNRDTDIENRCIDTKQGKGGVGWTGRLGLTYTQYWYYV